MLRQLRSLACYCGEGTFGFEHAYMYACGKDLTLRILVVTHPITIVAAASNYSQITFRDLLQTPRYAKPKLLLLSGTFSYFYIHSNQKI